MEDGMQMDMGGGHQVTFEVFEGEIAGDKTWSETHVTSSGGGSSYIGPQGGYVNTPTIRSHNSTHQEIWVRQPNGHEFPLQLTNRNVLVRPGHRVAVIVGANQLERRTLQLVNLTSRQLFDIDSYRDSFVRGAVGISRPSTGVWVFLSLLFGIVPAFFGLVYAAAHLGNGYAFWGGVAGWLAPVILVVLMNRIRLRRYGAKFDKARNKINEGLSKIHKSLA